MADKEQSFSDAVKEYKAETATPPPDPYSTSRKPGDILDEDGFLKVPLWACSCGHIDWPDPWYRRLADWITGRFSR